MIIERRWKRLLKARISPINIWGSGCLRPGAAVPATFLRPLALRGKLTAERFKNAQHLPLGDPGLLFRRLHDPSQKTKSYRWGVIAHYTDANSTQLPKIIEATPRARLIPLDIDPIETLRMIGDCDFIVSSSLHGLIAADAYGIPNWHIALERNLDGGEYKFKDYATAIHRGNISAYSIPNDGNLEKLINQHTQDLGYMKDIEVVAQRLESTLIQACN